MHAKGHVKRRDLESNTCTEIRKEDRAERNPDPKQVETEALADDVELAWALRVVPK